VEVRRTFEIGETTRPLYRPGCDRAWVERELGKVLGPADVLSLLAPEAAACVQVGDNPDDAQMFGTLIGTSEGRERFASMLHQSFLQAIEDVLQAGPGAHAVLRAETPYRELFGVPPA
jgi:hypothetical protein